MPKAFTEFGNISFEDGKLKANHGWFFMDGVSQPNMLDGRWIYLEGTFNAKDVASNNVTVLLSLGAEARKPFDEDEWMQLGCLLEVSNVKYPKSTSLDSARWILDHNSNPYDDLWAVDIYAGMPEYNRDIVIQKESEKFLVNSGGSITVGCSLPTSIFLTQDSYFGDEVDLFIGSRLLVNGKGVTGRTSPVATFVTPEADEIIDSCVRCR